MVQLGKALGRAVEELLTIVSVSTFYRWCRDEKAGKKKTNPKGGQPIKFNMIPVKPQE